jgi:hypothetical protein
MKCDFVGSGCVVVYPDRIKREMKGYDCDVAVDAHSGIRKVHLVGLSRRSGRLIAAQTLSLTPTLSSKPPIPLTTAQSGSTNRQNPSASLVPMACPSSFSASSAFSLVGPSLVGPAEALAVWAMNIPADAIRLVLVGIASGVTLGRLFREYN